MSNLKPEETKIVFMGTPEFAVPSLRSLLDAGFKVEAVVTQPDRPRGRGRRLRPSPVKELALEMGLRVLQPERASDPLFIQEVAGMGPDFLVVAAYGQILKRPLLECARIMPVNVHGSLLPKFRGAAPIQRAILEGERQTGITIMEMDEGMDTGPILLMEGLKIGENETFGELHDRMAALGARLLIEALHGILTGELQPREQPKEGISYAPPIRKEELEIDWGQSAQVIHRQIRAFDPVPGAYTTYGDERVRLFTPRLVHGQEIEGPFVPGEIIDVSNKGLTIWTGSGAILVKEVQWPGKRRMAVEAFIRGNPIPKGSVFGKA